MRVHFERFQSNEHLNGEAPGVMQFSRTGLASRRVAAFQSSVSEACAPFSLFVVLSEGIDFIVYSVAVYIRCYQ